MDVIVELRAGRLRLSDGKLVADPRKGLIRICQDEMGLSHFCWAERDASGSAVGEAETDIVVIPGECSFLKIPRPGSRVFELKFPDEKERNMFFWAQEADASTDDDYVAAVNMALTMQAGDEEEGAFGGSGGPAAMEAEPTTAGTAAPAAAAPAAAAAQQRQPAAAMLGGGAAGGINAADLAAVLGSIMSGAAGSAGAGGAGLLAQQQRMVDPGPSLGDVLKPEALAPLLRQPDMVEKLAAFLPEEHRSADAICELVATPQFRHQLDLLSHALMTGQLDTRQFGLPPGGFGVLDFLRSVQEKADKETGAGGQ